MGRKANMALLTTPKPSSVNSNTPSRVITRQEVSIARPTASTSRAEALKARLTGATPSQPVAPRPGGSTARRQDMAKLNKFDSPVAAKPGARTPGKDFSNIAPPPSGLAPGSELVQPDNTVEVSPQATAEAPSESLNPQSVALARKEIQLRKAQQKLKADQEAWKQEQAKYVSKDTLSSDTLKVLSEAGITPDKLVELQVNQASSQDPQQILLNRIADLESKLNGIVDPENGTLAQRDKAAYDQVLTQIRQDAELLVESNPAYETIKSEGHIQDVVELITSVFDSEGKILDVEEAADLVEAKLTERLVAQYERISKYEKIKAKIGKPAEQAEATPAQPTQQTQRNTTTLTNAGVATRPLSPRDRAVLKVQEALNAAKGR